MTVTPARAWNTAGVHPSLDVLGAYVDGDGDERTTARATEDHLMACARCRARLVEAGPTGFPEVAAVRARLLTDLPDQPGRAPSPAAAGAQAVAVTARTRPAGRVTGARPAGRPVVTGSRRRVLALTATAVVAGTAVLVAPAVFPGIYPGGRSVTAVYAATPPLLHYTALVGDPSPRQLLTTLAARAAAQTPRPRTGRYDFVRTRAWYWDMTSDPPDHSTHALDYTLRDQWLAQDGSGRLEETRGGVRTNTSGVLPAQAAGAPTDLPTDPTALQAVLAEQDHPTSTQGWFDAAGAVWDTQVVTPAMESALLLVLADKPNMVVRGTVTDRAGRVGVAISTDHDSGTGNAKHAPTSEPERYTLIINPRTGNLLDLEEVLFRAVNIPVKVPFTFSYDMWISSGYTDSTTTRP